MRKTRADPYRVLFFGVSTLDSFHCHTVWTPTECGEREHTLTASNITDMSSHTHTHTNKTDARNDRWEEVVPLQRNGVISVVQHMSRCEHTPEGEYA